MNFTVIVDNKEGLKTFLSSCESDYVDVICDGTIMMLISDSAEIFIEYILRVASRFNFKDTVKFRIEKKRFIPLIMEGSIEFTIKDMVVAKFLNKSGKVLYTIQFPHQEAFTVSYYHKIGLLQECFEYDRLQLAKILEISRIARSQNTDLFISEGIAYTKFSNTFVFQEVEFPNLALSARALSILYKYTSEVYNVKNYVIYAGDNLKIIVRKTRLLEQDEYDFLMNQKYTHVMKLDLSAPLDLAYRCKLSEGKFVLDIMDESATFSEGKVLYKSPIVVEDIKSKASKKEESNDIVSGLDITNLDSDEFVADISSMGKLSRHKIPKIEIPDYILRTLLYTAKGKTSITLKIHKTFVRIDVGSLKIIFGRKTNDE